MATYVLVDADGIDKVIKYGPLELEDPNSYVVPEGLKIMPQDEALAQGYRFPEGGAALAPDQPAGAGGDASGDQDEQGDQNEQ